ncbi:hypothetical protein AKO1_008807 [Acrasis kona]|uniref:Beta-lactamase-related domain-containing protein n=1 Tax=Acrasis kona TaxID=1008807 RepID=A0AAW2ZFU0_9EUKA
MWIRIAISVCIVATTIYILQYGATFHTPQCTLLGFNCPPSVVVDGFTTDKYRALREVYQEMFDQGEDLTSCFAVYENAELVVDLCGGNVTTALGEKNFRDVVQNVFSSTKTLVKITVAMLVDRGLLDYQEPVSKYWPEFAQGNKGHVTISDLMGHASGVSAIDQNIPWDVIGTDDKLDELGRILARQKHNFEVVRRVDPKNRTIAQFATDEIIQPLDVRFYFGLPEDLEPELYTYFYDHPKINMALRIMPRVLFSLPFVESLKEDQPFFWSVLTGDAFSTFIMVHKIFGKGSPFSYINPTAFFHSKQYRRVQHLAGMNGFSQAIAIAKIGRIMTEGVIDGRVFLSKETREKALTPLESEY